MYYCDHNEQADKHQPAAFTLGMHTMSDAHARNAVFPQARQQPKGAAGSLRSGAIYTPLQTRSLARFMRASDAWACSPRSSRSFYLDPSSATRKDPHTTAISSSEAENAPLRRGNTDTTVSCAEAENVPPGSIPTMAQKSHGKHPQAFGPADGLAYALSMHRQSRGRRPESRRPSTCFVASNPGSKPLREHTLAPSSWFTTTEECNSSSVGGDFSHLPIETAGQQEGKSSMSAHMHRARSDETSTGRGIARRRSRLDATLPRGQSAAERKNAYGQSGRTIQEKTTMTKECTQPRTSWYARTKISHSNQM